MSKNQNKETTPPTDGDNMLARYGSHVKALIAAGNGPGYAKALGGLFAAISNHVRAQPEGEAPQDEMVADANRYVYLASTADWSAIEDLLRRSTAESATELKRDLDKLIDTRLKSAITLPLYTAPAAQQAESGAQAGEYCDHPAFIEIMDAILTPQGIARFNADEDVNLNREFASAIFLAGLAAQSQGAQPLPTAGAGDPDLDAARWAEVFYRNAETFTVRDLGIVRAAWKEAIRRAALAAKAEAPADLDRLQDDLAWHKEALAAVRGKLTAVWEGVSKAVEEYSRNPCEGEPFDRLGELLNHLSQQVAAPGALEAIAHKTRPGQALNIHSAIDLITEVHIDAKRAACSAPGTPEAPADDLECLAGLYRKLRGMHWHDKSLTVVYAEDIKLGVQTYSGDMLDAEIERAAGGDLKPAAIGQPSELARVHAFLMGEAELEGVTFGARHPTKAGEFWWRLNLRAAMHKARGAQA